MTEVSYSLKSIAFSSYQKQRRDRIAKLVPKLTEIGWYHYPDILNFLLRANAWVNCGFWDDEKSSAYIRDIMEKECSLQMLESLFK